MLITLLFITWFLITLLILLITLTVFFLKETYIFKIHLELVNQVTPLATVTLTVVDEHPQLLLLALLGFFLTTLLSILALALIVSLSLHLIIKHLEREHQWAFNIAATAQCPLPHTTTTLPIIAANWDSNNPTQVYFEYIREHQD
ncbi:uncharacterized protein FIBRA_09607 [Fibroporia radiculosa]|uniref:Uncharacterized protein n=1 Tax=Fibroporia radiculosa TaxID=599839 RepID=J7RWE1_9APHY|nr:uncharacterized protein FIBRA_09607 [Fibroporia radiculosa]CCM07260.1 predicted protein [Fibroporia radiculosa]